MSFQSLFMFTQQKESISSNNKQTRIVEIVFMKKGTIIQSIFSSFMSSIMVWLLVVTHVLLLVPQAFTSSSTSSSCSFCDAFIMKNTAVPMGYKRGGLGSTSIPFSAYNVNAKFGRTMRSSNNNIMMVYLQSPTTQEEAKKEVEEEEEEQQQQQENLTYFEVLAGNIVNCLMKSDLKRKGGGDGGGSTGWTSWVDDASSYQLKGCVDLLSLSIPQIPIDIGDLKPSQLADRDESLKWIRWLKASPSPLIIEMSNELRKVANQFVTDQDLVKIETTREEFINRMGLRIITLPSGKSLNEMIRTPAGALAFGTLLWGGARRFRLLPGKFKRKTGEREAIKANENEKMECWIQYGGPERNYEAMDMGPCAILEIIILPSGLKFDHALDEKGMDSHMTMTQLCWAPQKMFQFYTTPKATSKLTTPRENDNCIENSDVDAIIKLSGRERNELLEASFTEAVGGLRPQIESIVRRVLDGRVFRSFDEDGECEIVGEQSLLDAKELESLGLNPVRGLLLYGPPGCGKTALAREISKSLRARKPKIVAAPELLDRWVGGSEKLVRALFTDAEQELNSCGGDATKSSLHVIVIDEIDAVFRKRTSSEDSAATTRASAVNQILAKLDGVNTLSNVLLIGMTNRRDLLDEALLRPGRLEVQVEIPLPTKEGRREILQIHFEELRKRGRISEPLCKAIDGPYVFREDSHGGKESRKYLKRQLGQVFQTRTLNKRFITDLASERFTKDFSGADIQGLVRCSGSIALARARQQGMGLEGLIITIEDVLDALEELKS